MKIPPPTPRDVTPDSDWHATDDAPPCPTASRSGRTTETAAGSNPTAPPTCTTNRSGSTPPRWPTHDAIVVHPAEARAAGRTVKTKLSDQFVPGLVDRQDLQLEELLVAEPIRLPLHRLDLVVRPLHRARRDHHVVVGQQTTPMRRQRLGHLLQHLDPRCLRALDPAIEQQRPELLPRLLPELAEVLLQVVGHGQRLVQSQRLLQLLPLVLLLVEVLRRLQQQLSRPLQDLPLHPVGRLAVQRATQVGELLVEELHDVEAVEDDLRLRQVRRD